MNNYQIIESLAKTSNFNSNHSKVFLDELVKNLGIDANHHDHLEIRAKIANRTNFVDAQEVSSFGS